MSYRDLEFEHAFRLRRERDGRVVRRWAPVGMPRLAPHLERCVFYLYGDNPAVEDEFIGPGGTGFFVARPSMRLPGTWHVYAVSNRHVVCDFSHLRVNVKPNDVRFIKIEPTDWAYSATDDIAVTDVTSLLEPNYETGFWSDAISWVNEINFVTRNFMGAYNVGIGDHTIMIGLFVSHAGGMRNVPVGRFGSLAAVPDDNTPVRLSRIDPLARPSYLNDMRSRTGFSGSPVWVWRSPYDDMNSFKTGQGYWPNLTGTEHPFLALLGVHRGQFPEETTLMTTEAASEEARQFRAGDTIEIASAMTVIVPSWEITAIIDRPNFQAQRDAQDERPERISLSNEMAKIMRAQERQLGQRPNAALRLF